MNNRLHRKYRRRGVFPVIAVLMLLAIAVATEIVVYVWVIGLSGTLTKSGSTQVSEQLELETYNWTSSNLSIHIRNTGGRTVTVAEIYIDGINQSIILPILYSRTICIFIYPTRCFTHTVTSSAVLTITPQNTTTITVAVSGVIGGIGTTHTVKIITTDGGVFAFTVLKGKSK